MSIEKLCIICRKEKPAGLFYKGAAKCKECYNIYRSTSHQVKSLNSMLQKFTRYRDNVQWHLDNNNPEGNSRSICVQRINDYTEIINDLQKALKIK